MENKTEGKTERKIEGKKLKNPWMFSTIALIVIAAALIFFLIRGGITGNVVSGDIAAENLIDYAKSIGVDAQVLSTTDLGSFYEITMTVRGQLNKIYVTKDGEYMIDPLGKITGQATQEEQQPTEVPKTDKPVVEAFVFSYCPYGLQFEKAMIPVYKLLKNDVDFEIVAIGAMHGEYEKQETLRQICIEKNYGKNKLWSYLEKFAADTAIGSCGSDMTCSKPLAEKLMTSLGISKDKINTCMTKDAETIYAEQNARASELGITGSPGLAINNVEVQADRSPEAIKQVICDAFITAPEECSQTLSTSQATAGFGSDASASSSSSASGSC